MDMLQMPQGPNSTSNDSTSIVEGCPVVHMQDSAEDLKHIILLFYGDQ